MPTYHSKPQQRPEDRGLAGRAAPPPHVGRINTREVDDYRDWFTARYADHKRHVRARRRGFEFYTESGALGNLTATHTNFHAATVEVSLPAVDYLAVSQLRSGRCLNQPLLLAAAEYMVAVAVLATFPNTTMTIEVRTPRDPATAATVRRAVAFIDEHADAPITLTDIATAAGVVPHPSPEDFGRT
jgi:hypothetical protein